MRWLCIAVVLLVAAEKSQGVDLSDLKMEFEDLLAEKDVLFRNISFLQTVQAAYQELSNKARWILIPELEEKNRQQNMLLEHLKIKAKKLQHHIVDVILVVESAGVLAEATMFDMPNLTSGVDSIASENDALDDALMELSNNVTNTGDGEEQDIDDAIDDLNDDLQDRIDDFENIQDFVKNKSCEYGSVYLKIPDSETVAFTSEFTGIPSVSYSIVGFRSHINGARGSVDLLAFNVTISAVDLTTFTIETTEADVEDVEPKDLYVRYMACANLNVTLPSDIP